MFISLVVSGDRFVSDGCWILLMIRFILFMCCVVFSGYLVWF